MNTREPFLRKAMEPFHAVSSPFQDIIKTAPLLRREMLPAKFILLSEWGHVLEAGGFVKNGFLVHICRSTTELHTVNGGWDSNPRPTGT